MLKGRGLRGDPWDCKFFQVIKFLFVLRTVF